ncbi:glycosyltransferase family 1 protein, partial [Microbispora triticiradicis]
PRALSRALGDLLARPELRSALSAAGARRARARYGWRRIAEQTESVYRNLAGGRLGALAAAGG